MRLPLRWALLALLALLAPGAFGQQITRFAVIDMGRVYTTFFRESRAVRAFEEQSSKVQAEIDRMMAEIQNLKNEQVDAEMRGDSQQAIRLEDEVYRKSELLKDYYNTKTAQLENQRAKLAESSDFVEQVRAEVQLIAESEGYSMVLNLNDNKGIVWFSQAVDITDKVIQSLLTKAGR